MNENDENESYFVCSNDLSFLFMCAHCSMRVQCVFLTLNTDGFRFFFLFYFHLFRSCWHTFMHMFHMFDVQCSHCIWFLTSYISLKMKKRKQLLALGYIILIIFTRIFLSHSALLKLELMIPFKQNEWMAYRESKKKPPEWNETANEWRKRRKLPRRDILCHRSFLMAYSMNENIVHDL